MLVLYTLFSIVYSHGALLVPSTRVKRTQNGVGVWSDQRPLQPALHYPKRIGESFICRSDAKTTSTTWQAGTTVEIKASFAIPHAGNCEFLISYDNAQRTDMKWFKIGNWKDCGINPADPAEGVEKTRNVFLPSWLPEGQAVFRFSWAALHNNPPEFYVDCSDIKIVSDTKALPAFVATYKLLNPSPWSEEADWFVAPAEIDGKQVANPSVESDFITGPPCAEDAEYNQCRETRAGTKGHVAISGGSNPQQTTIEGTRKPTTGASTKSQETTVKTGTDAPTPTSYPNGLCVDHEFPNDPKSTFGGDNDCSHFSIGWCAYPELQKACCMCQPGLEDYHCFYHDSISGTAEDDKACLDCSVEGTCKEKKCKCRGKPASPTFKPNNKAKCKGWTERMSGMKCTGGWDYGSKATDSPKTGSQDTTSTKSVIQSTTRSAIQSTISAEGGSTIDSKPNDGSTVDKGFNPEPNKGSGVIADADSGSILPSLCLASLAIVLLL